jgi:hypothetical protein
VNSGSPGYREMSRLRIGYSKQANPNVEAHIAEYKNGYVLRGADNSGKCYNIETSLSTPKTKTKKFLIKTENDINYFDDPLLTFEDSILTGCHLDMNYDELKTFCDSKSNFENMMIF